MQMVSRYFGGAAPGDLGAVEPVEPGVLVAGALVGLPKPLLPAGR
jgi:hypothetical protein